MFKGGNKSFYGEYLSNEINMILQVKYRVARNANLILL